MTEIRHHRLRKPDNSKILSCPSKLLQPVCPPFEISILWLDHLLFWPVCYMVHYSTNPSCKMQDKLAPKTQHVFVEASLPTGSAEIVLESTLSLSLHSLQYSVK